MTPMMSTMTVTGADSTGVGAGSAATGSGGLEDPPPPPPPQAVKLANITAPNKSVFIFIAYLISKSKLDAAVLKIIRHRRIYKTDKRLTEVTMLAT